LSAARSGPSSERPALDRRILVQALRVLVITDERLAAPRPVDLVVRQAIAGGARAVQLRAKAMGARDLLVEAQRLLDITRREGALLFVNDRADVALAVGADGVHLGPDDPPVAAVRGAAPPGFLIGFSTDDPVEARRAEADGADYLGCGAVWSTGTKNVGEEAIGLDRLDEVARAVGIPVLAIGGVTPERAREVARTRAAGVAVVGAVMRAEDPAAVTASLLEPFLERGD
jgi:thiamine-phosphate pyrophosphorylase